MGQRVPVLVDQRAPAEHHADFGPVAEERELLFELGRLPGVVGVEERDELAAAQTDAEVLRPRLAELVGADVADATVGEERPHRVGRVVGRAVVDDDEFPVRERLREHRLDRDRQEPGVVLRGHDDGDEGHDSSSHRSAV